MEMKSEMKRVQQNIEPNLLGTKSGGFVGMGGFNYQLFRMSRNTFWFQNFSNLLKFLTLENCFKWPQPSVLMYKQTS